MSPARPPRLARFLPPLVVLLAFGVIVARCAQEPYREEAQAQITGLIAGGDFDRATDHLNDYLGRYADEEDRWFAARAWFALQQPGHAIDAIWGHPDLPTRPGTARRFGEIGLLALGWSGLSQRNPTAREPHALIALVEGGHPRATEQLQEYAATLDIHSAARYFFPAYRRATRRPLEVMVGVYRTREEENFAVAAALAALNENDYPEKAADVALLESVQRNPAWREQKWLAIWAVSAVALGRSGDAGALRTLQEIEAGLESGTSPADRHALALIRNGIVAGGDWAPAQAQLEAAQQEGAPPMPTLWFLEALIHRYRVGDQRALPGLIAYWTRLGPRFPGIRARIARAVLLQDPAPPSEAQSAWEERMLTDLERPDASLMSHVLARAWRLRDARPDAREASITALVDALRVASGSAPGSGGVGREADEAFLEALRALYLYG